MNSRGVFSVELLQGKSVSSAIEGNDIHPFGTRVNHLSVLSNTQTGIPHNRYHNRYHNRLQFTFSKINVNKNLLQTIAGANRRVEAG